MPSPFQLQIPIALAIVLSLLVLAAERLHERRIRLVAHLATGPRGRARRWVRAVPMARALATGAMAWALGTLWFAREPIPGEARDPGATREGKPRVLFLADLSPSMLLRDAGAGRDRTRAERMSEVIDAVLRRIDGRVIYGVMGLYTDAMPVIVDAEDSELVRNVFNGLPIWYAMEAGKTDLGTGVRKTLDRLKDAPAGSVTLFVCTDGDTVDLGQIPRPPPGVRDAYVLGAGDPVQGTFIDGHMSRQDPSVLGALAGRLRGRYIDVNERHVPTAALGELATGAAPGRRAIGPVDIAIYTFAAGAAALALLPVLLDLLGSDWRAVRVPRRGSGEVAA